MPRDDFGRICPGQRSALYRASWSLPMRAMTKPRTCPRIEPAPSLTRHQRRIAARRGDVGRDRLFLGKAVQIVRAARLRTRARQPAPAERLRPDDRADLIAVDIDIADRRARRDVRRNAVDPRG